MNTDSRVLCAIIALYLVLTTAWNFVTPPFEAPDENLHVRYVLFLADHGHLPDQRFDVAEAGTAIYHPPLYYGLLAMGLYASGLPHPSVSVERVPNWSWETMPRNYFQPWSGPDAYVHFMRGLSSAFGLITIVCTYIAATALGGTAVVRAGAAAAVATLPQFTFMSGAVNPDTAAAAFSAIALVLLVRILVAPSPRWATAAVFGTATALAVLCKIQSAYLLALAALAYIFVRPTIRRLFVRHAIAAALPFGALTGWYFALNAARYGDPTALSAAVSLAPELRNPHALLSLYFLIPFPMLTYESFLGAFGWMNVYLPSVFYLAYGVFWVGALWGAMDGIVFRRAWAPARKVLVLAPLLVLILIVYLNLSSIAPQGRYFFPALTAISLLFSLGLAELPGAIGRWGPIAAPVFLLGVNAYSLVLVATSFAHA